MSRTAVATTTSIFLPESTSNAFAQTITTTEPPACFESQIIINPGFDLDSLSKAPWIGDGDVICHGAYSAPCALSWNLENGSGFVNIQQTLHNLEGTYTLSYRYRAVSAVNLGTGFSCNIAVLIGDETLPETDLSEFGDWRLQTQTWTKDPEIPAEALFQIIASCSGEYDELAINVDDITFTSDCGPQAP
ncbi:hypothetical protein FHETE_4027 [Fusarium heterosporum]|uniref:Uncharacterized protein n=1 Tax=Fusarium heterosporum TaxID=42747 RepID=A0A8H5WQH4_FUSHE|nr:hypothetical protein FHETE_4027 [Fusarium heterosporum]